MASLRFLHQSDPIGTKVWMPACKGRESSDDGKPLVFEGVSSGYETNMAKLRGEGREDIIRAPFWMCVVLGEVTP